MAHASTLVRLQETTRLVVAGMLSFPPSQVATLLPVRAGDSSIQAGIEMLRSAPSILGYGARRWE